MNRMTDTHGGNEAGEVPNAESVPAPRFKPRTFDSKVGRYHYTKGSDPKVRKNHLCHYIPPLLKRGDWCGVIPSTTVLWPVHNHVPFKQACIYTTEDTIVCDEIHIHTNKLQHGFFLNILITN